MREPIPDISKKLKSKKTQLYRLKNSPKHFLAKAQKAIVAYFVRFSFKY
jgi:hypothetical protein